MTAPTGVGRPGTDPAAPDGTCRTLRLDGGILVAHDGSAGARAALTWAAALARRAGLPLHVVRAWGLVGAPRPAEQGPGFVPPLEAYERAVREELAADVARERLGPDVPVHLHVLHRPPVDGLVEAAAGADLLVVGARGHGRLVGLALGSISEALVHRAPCPVTVVRADAPGRLTGGPSSGRG